LVPAEQLEALQAKLAYHYLPKEPLHHLEGFQVVLGFAVDLDLLAIIKCPAPSQRNRMEAVLESEFV